MKTKLLFLLALAPSLMQAQSKIDLPGLARIAQERSELKTLGVEETERMLPALIVPATDDCLSDLLRLGIEAEALEVTIAADIPLSMVEAVSELPSVKLVSISQPMELMMNYARPASGVTEAQEGFSYGGQNHKFDGSGVVAGLYDSGLDPNHINFNNADGESRVKRVWWYKSQIPTEYSPESRYNKITSLTTDNALGTHATHVAGIMAGSYNGPGTYAYTDSPNPTTAKVVDGNIPYYGVGTGTELAFCVGTLNPSYVSLGVKKIVDYAKSQGLPAVVNLSLGTTIGPHDGSDSFSKEIAAQGERALICVAAGNDGNINTSIIKDVTPETPIRAFFSANTCNGGVVDIWGTDSTPFKVTFGIYNMVTGQLTKLASVGGDAGTVASVSTSNASFASNFTGSISMQANVDVLNKRYNVLCSTCSFAPIVSNKSKLMAIIVETTNNQKVYVYGNSNVSFSAEGVAGYTDGSPDGGFNDINTAGNVISVGAYNTCLRWGTLGGGLAYYADERVLGTIAPFSGYGKSFQGYSFPNVCAPGATIMSSFSRYYVNQSGKANSCVGKATDADGVTNYWGFMQGTSQASPYAAGTMALWLQACPTLTYEQAMEVLEKTSKIPEGTTEANRWGYGKIDAVAGLKYILQNSASVGAVWEDDEQRLVVSPTGAGYSVVLAGEPAFDVTLYDLQGRAVAKAAGVDGAAEVETAGLGAGVYVLRVAGPTSNLSRKIAVR